MPPKFRYRACLTCFLWFAVSSSNSYGQATTPGERRILQQVDRLLATELPDTVKLNSLFAIANVLDFYVSPLPLQLHQRGVALARAAGAPRQAGWFHSRIGLILNNKHDYVIDSADWHWRVALDYFEQVGDDEMAAFMHGYLRYTSTELQKYDLALRHCLDALTYYRARRDSFGIGATYNDIAGVLLASEDYEEALNYALRAETLLKADSSQTGYFELSATRQKMADCYKVMGDSARMFRALDGALQAINVMGSNSRWPSYIENLLLIANGYAHFGDYSRSLSEYGEALRLVDRYVPGTREQVLLPMGDLYTKLESYPEALATYTQVNEAMLQDHYDKLATCYAGTGRYDQAYTYQRAYQTRVDSVKAAEAAQSMNRLKTEFETEQKEVQIVQQQSQLSQQARVQQLFWIIGALLALVVAGLLLGVRKNRRKNQLLEQLNQDLTVKHSLLGERNAQNELLLKEIHHRVKNNLEIVASLLSLQAAQVDSPEVLAAMKESQNRVQSMGIVHRKLYQGGELAAIEMKDYFLNLSESILDSFGAEDRVTIEVSMEALEIDVDEAVPIGLIVNELMTNALKYAFPENRPGSINICLEQLSPTNLRLEVSDNGVGKSDGPAVGTGFGQQLIELLTRQLNGQMETLVQGGTKVRFLFDLEKAI